MPKNTSTRHSQSDAADEPRVIARLPLAEDTYDHFQKHYEDLPVGYIVEAGGLIRGANRAFAQLLRRDAGELLGAGLATLIDPADMDLFYRHRARALVSGLTERCELRLIAADGERIWVQWNCAACAKSDHARNESRIVVTELGSRKQAQERLLGENEVLRAVFDASPILMAILSQAGFVEVANRQWERILGWETRDFRSERIWPRIFPHRRTRDEAREFILRAAGRWQEFRVTTRFGGIVDLRCAAARLGRDGRVLIAEDITEQRRVEEWLHDRRETLDRLAGLNTISEMAAAIAHEVNQPLTALINFATGAAYRLRGVPGIPRDALEAVEKSVIEAHRASDIIRHVRALVARRRIEQAPLDLNALIQSLARVLSVAAARSNIALQVAFEPGLPSVPADRVQIEQVLVNLVQNAIEACEETPGALREVLLCTRLTEGGHVMVSVVDRGHGITPEVRQKLFTPFFTTKPYGTGIGLSVCLSIIEAHGGRLWADDNPEGGAVFRFTLPLAAASREAGALNGNAEAPPVPMRAALGNEPAR